MFYIKFKIHLQKVFTFAKTSLYLNVTVTDIFRFFKCCQILLISLLVCHSWLCLACINWKQAVKFIHNLSQISKFVFLNKLSASYLISVLRDLWSMPGKKTGPTVSRRQWVEILNVYYILLWIIIYKPENFTESSENLQRGT